MPLYGKCPPPPPKRPAEPLLLPENLRVCALYGLACTGIYMVFYFLRLVVFLSCVEDPPATYHGIDGNRGPGANAHLETEDPRWAIPAPLRRASRRAIATEFIATKLHSLFSIGRALFLWDPNDIGLITSSLFTCIAQLRYMSGQSFWLLRAAETHIIWWVCVRRFLVGVVGTVLWGIVYLLVWSLGPDSTSPFACDSIICGATMLSDIMVSLWMRGEFVCHSLRTLAATTGRSKNVALSALDASHLRRADKSDPVLPIVIYIIARNIACLIPHFMVRKHIPMNLILYIPVAHPTEVFKDPTVRWAILHAGITWAALSFALVLPSFSFLVRSHAQELSLAEASIVGYSRIRASRSGSQPTFSNPGTMRLRLITHRMIRAFRLAFHAGVVVILFLILAGCALWPALNRLAVGNEMVTLLRGAYILLGPNVNCLLMVVTVAAPVIAPIWALFTSVKIIYNQTVPE